MKEQIREKAEQYAKKVWGSHYDCIYIEASDETYGDICIKDYTAGYQQAFEDLGKDLIIAMLKSQLKVERSILEELTNEGTAIYYMITANKIAELERQLKELKE